MDNITVFLTILSVLGTICSIIFGYLAFRRNRSIDTKTQSKEEANQAVNIASLQIDIKYTRDSISRIERKLDDFEKSQNSTNEKLVRFEEHLERVDGRLDKLEKLTGGK